MSQPGENLARVIGVWGDVLRTGRADALGDILDPAVVWKGVTPELVCEGREQALRLLGHAPLPAITRVEAEEHGDEVTVSVESAAFPEGPGGPQLTPAGEPRHITFSFRDGKVVKMHSFPTREAARQALRPLVP